VLRVMPLLLASCFTSIVTSFAKAFAEDLKGGVICLAPPREALGFGLGGTARRTRIE
jgi:hypothetical protein